MTQRALTANFALNIAGTLLPLALSLLTIPIYIAHIGAARYGVLAIVWVLLGYFGFIDFGLSRASANALSRLGHATPAERGPVLVTALYLNGALGLTGGLVLYAASGFLLSRFSSLPPDLAAEATSAMPWVAFMLPIAMVSAIGTGAMESRERFLASNVFQTFGGVLGQLLPIACVLLIGPSLTIVIPAAFISRAIPTVLIWAFVLHAERPVDLRAFDRARVRELIGYGAWVSVSSMLNPLLQTADQMLIGLLLGPASVAYYSVPMSLAMRSQIVAVAMAKTLFPRLSRLTADEARLLAVKAFVTLSFGFGLVCGLAVILSAPFLRLWLGVDFAAHSILAAQILLVGSWVNGLAFIPYTMLQGQGRPDLTAKIHLVEVLPFLAILYLLVRAFGLPGAALAWSLRVGVDALILLVVARCWTRALARALTAVALMGACWVAAQVLPPSLLTSGLAAVVAAAAFAGCGLALDPVLRATALSMWHGAGRARSRLGARLKAS